MLAWHNGRLIKREIAVSHRRNSILWGVGPAMLFVGFFFVFIFGLLDIWQGILVSVIVLLLGIGLFMLMYPISNRLEKFDKALSAILSNEIVYLHSDIFKGLNMTKRIRVAKALTASPNLNSYEIIGDLALAKKVLHISEERLKSFLKAENFGMLGELNGKQFQIIESGNMIKSDELLRAKNIENTKQDREFLRILGNPHLTRSKESVKKFQKQLKILKGIVIVAGFAIVGIGVLAMFMDWGAAFALLILIGTGVACLSFLTDWRCNLIDKHAYKIEEIIENIGKNEILSIGDKCFDGISPYKRGIIVKKLITSGKVKERKLIDGIAVININFEMSYEELMRALSQQSSKTKKNKAKTDGKKVKTIKIEVVTNCPSCGAPYREGVTFCTSCGTVKA